MTDEMEAVEFDWISCYRFVWLSSCLLIRSESRSRSFFLNPVNLYVITTCIMWTYFVQFYLFGIYQVS